MDEMVSLDAVVAYVSSLCPACQAKWREMIAKPSAVSTPRRPLTFAQAYPELFSIMREVAREGGVPLGLLRAKNNTAKCVELRRRVALRARQKGFSFPAIGKALGKHHSTIVHLVNGHHG